MLEHSRAGGPPTYMMLEGSVVLASLSTLAHPSNLEMASSSIFRSYWDTYLVGFIVSGITLAVLAAQVTGVNVSIIGTLYFGSDLNIGASTLEMYIGVLLKL